MSKSIMDSKINFPDIKKLSKNPNILIAAGFWEKERYEAAMVCYRFMREIDDLIDDRKAVGETIDNCEQKALESQVLDWINCISGKEDHDEAFNDITNDNNELCNSNNMKIITNVNNIPVTKLSNNDDENDYDPGL